MARSTSLVPAPAQAPALRGDAGRAGALKQVDLAFVVDTTGSMGPFIDAARSQMIATLQALTEVAPIWLRVAVVEYRDHPPQDNTFVTRAHGFTADLDEAERMISSLAPYGGGDAPEAVYDGLHTACMLDWLPHSHRLAVLVGDAPPHGTGGGGDCFPSGCPCGLDADEVTALVEASAISLYALPMHPGAEGSFGLLARFTGGESFPVRGGAAAIEALKVLLAKEFADLDFDRQVLEASVRLGEWTVDELCQAVEGTRGRVSASVSRLGRRGLLGRA
jgi:hypothetical protein